MTDPRQLARTAVLASRVRALQQVAELTGGFAMLAESRDHQGWEDLAEHWQGEIRLVPAVSALGLKSWRHGTVHDLVGWVLSGCHGWGDESQPVVAAGTRYNTQLPVVSHGPKAGGNVRLLTLPLQVARADSPNAWLKAMLRREPQALALCVVPRG